MCIESSLRVGNVTATVTDHAANGQDIASAFTVDVTTAVPFARRYAVALHLLARFLEHTDIIPDVHHVRTEAHADYMTYAFSH